MILACSKKYYQAAVKNDHSFDHLSALSFIEYRRHAVVVKNWFRHHFHRAPSRLNTVMTVDSIQAVISGIRSHLGLGVIATHMAWTEISSGDLAPIRTQEASALNQISLALLKDKVPTLSERTFLGHLRKQIRVGGTAQGLSEARRIKKNRAAKAALTSPARTNPVANPRAWITGPMKAEAIIMPR